MVAYFIRSVLLAGLVTLAGSVYAQNPSGGPWEKFSIGIGGFTTTSNSELQLNSSDLGLGVVVDLENTLGVSSSVNTGRFDLLYRFGQTQRHQVQFKYFESRRSGTRTLSEEITIGDVTFPVNANVTTDFDVEFGILDYGYAFIQDERVRLSGTVGLHITGVGLKIEDPGNALLEEDSFTAPLPAIGLRLDVALAKNWILKTSVDLFYLEYDNFAGGLSDTYLGVEWNPFKHVGFGLGYNSVRYRVKGEGSEPNGMTFDGKIKYDMSGLLLYAKYFF